jgi:hypothetical protein
VAHGVADGEHGDVVRGAEAVEPVAADPVVAVRGQVAAGQLQPAGRGQLRQHRPLQRLGDAAALLQQPLGAPPLTGRDVGSLRGARRHDPQLQLRRAGAGQVGEHGQVGLGPPARLVVDGAQRADHPAVGVRQRHARVGDDLQLGNGEVVPHQGWRRASSMTRGSAEATTCWQNEWLSGVRRSLCYGSSRPAAPGNT